MLVRVLFHPRKVYLPSDCRTTFGFFILGWELTDSMLLRLSQQITSAAELHHLAINGLGMRHNVIERHIVDCGGDITHATLRVLQLWCRMYENRTVAYTELCKSLRKIGRAACCIIGSIRMNILMLDTRNVEQTKDVRMYT